MRAGSDCWGEAEISPANGVTWVVDCRLEKGRPHAGDRVGRQTAVKALKDLRQRNPLDRPSAPESAMASTTARAEADLLHKCFENMHNHHNHYHIAMP